MGDDMTQAVAACMKPNPNHLSGIDGALERLGDSVRNAPINIMSMFIDH